MPMPPLPHRIAAPHALGARRWLFLAALAVVLAGCTANPGIPTDPAQAQNQWQTRNRALHALTGFELSGRLAATGAALSGQLRWQQQGAGFNLRLTGPFGAGALALDGDGERIRIRQRDLTQDLPLADAHETLLRRTGWPLPVQPLRYWVLGMAAPDSDFTVQADAAGRPETLQQAGWTLRFSDYRAHVALPDLPYRIEARPDGNGEDWRAVLTVHTLLPQP